ncbi:MAG: cytochrome c biogenesis protein CcsA [Chlorobi bacterium]|nr:cytochrome c biogenesis protein CcsA [Chlorobiota bacterium]
MNKIKDILFSMQLTGILLMLFAIVIGFATFVENDFGPETSKYLIYNSLWFEIMLLLLAINLTGNIFRYKMYELKKWPMFLFHISFLVIFIGAALTRYVGFEGMMHIRQGAQSSEMTSDKTYVEVNATDGTNHYSSKERVFNTPAAVIKYKDGFSVGDKKVNINIEKYFMNAAESIVNEEGGKPIIWLVISNPEKGRTNLYLNDNETLDFAGVVFSLNNREAESDVTISLSESDMTFMATDTTEYMSMATGETELLSPDTLLPLNQRALYKINDVSFVVKQMFTSGKIKLVSGSAKKDMNSMDAFTAKVVVDGKTEYVDVYGGKGFLMEPKKVNVNGVDLEIGFGADRIELPFAIQLNKFEMERYPGSNSPSSYASEVTVIDKARNIEMPHRIYMNHVLNYDGFRFFQSSFDQDEKGTILSVNHDRWGTTVTYIGYLIMAIGMFFTIFNKSSRFHYLIKLSSKLRETRKSSLTSLLIFFSIGILSLPSAFAQEINTSGDLPPVIDKSIAAEFGKLLIQDNQGRIKPLSTQASEVLRKLSRKTTFEGQTPEQVFLGMMAYPSQWQKVPMIKVKHPELKSILGIKGKYASFGDIVDLNGKGGYLISEYVNKAYAKTPSQRGTFDKEVMKLDDRVNVAYMVYMGAFIKAFPIPGHSNQKWVTPDKADEHLKDEEALFVKGILSMFLSELREAQKSGNYEKAKENLQYIFQYQRKHGKDVMPSKSQVNAEIFYNKSNIFGRLVSLYGLIGFVLLVLHFITIFKPGMKLKWPVRISLVLLMLVFLLHTLGLALRWKISGHAPWSNGYESMLYIGWATMLAGIIFVKRSPITLAVTALLASLILAIAGLSWMDPEITNLVPVLKSYWLIVHVAIITASYGFLALAALLGFVNLILMNLKSEKNLQRIDLTIQELSAIIEMTMVIGLFMLTIGTFLGGVWANESWGRYWGWDPKETWALVTVLVYSFVVHMRYIPGFKGSFAMSFAALISYASVMMTYFGVNYYLSGLHSYAAGDSIPVPNFVYYTLIVIFVVGIMAWVTERKFIKK